MICFCPNCQRKLTKKELGIFKVKCRDCGFECGGKREFMKNYPDQIVDEESDFDDTISDFCRQCGNFENWPNCTDSCGFMDENR